MLKDKFDLRRNSNFSSWQVYHGTGSLYFIGPDIWEFVPEDTKQPKGHENFKNKTKK